MGENQASRKRNMKPVIIVIAVIVFAVAAFFAIKPLVAKTDDSKSQASHEAALAGEGGNSTEKITTTTANSGLDVTDNTENDIAVGEIADNNSSDADKTTTTKKPSSTTNKNTEKASFEKNVKSTFLKGHKASRRWSASSVISKVVAEEIKVKLNVYDALGNKTAATKKCSLYVAEIETKPSRVSVIAANQFTKTTIAYMTDIINNYQTKTNQDVLFATTNEMCARDYENPNGRIFYNGNDTLTATVIKNGTIAQRGEASKDSLVIYKNGKWEFPKNVSMSTSADLIKSGVIASVSYTYPVIWEGKKYDHPDCGENTGIWTDHIIMDGVNKTLIGKIGDNKYVVVCSFGFGHGYLAEYMLNDLGVEYAYWGNGGVSAAMYIKGYDIITPNDYAVHGDLLCIK